MQVARVVVGSGKSVHGIDGSVASPGVTFCGRGTADTVRPVPGRVVDCKSCLKVMSDEAVAANVAGPQQRKAEVLAAISEGRVDDAGRTYREDGSHVLPVVHCTDCDAPAVTVTSGDLSADAPRSASALPRCERHATVLTAGEAAQRDEGMCPICGRRVMWGDCPMGHMSTPQASPVSRPTSTVGKLCKIKRSAAGSRAKWRKGR